MASSRLRFKPPRPLKARCAMESKTIGLTTVPESLLTRLNSRDVALWVTEGAARTADRQALAEAVRLPWQLVILESADNLLTDAVTAPESAEDPKVRRRGYPAIIDNPNEVQLPPRSLPIYKLEAAEMQSISPSLTAQLRRLLILDTLKRAGPRELFLLGDPAGGIPGDLLTLWAEGFRPLVTLVSSADAAFEQLDTWRRTRPAGGQVALLPTNADQFCRDLVELFDRQHSGERLTIKVRNFRGESRTLDITGRDDPQHPVLAKYELVQYGDVRPLSPEDLTVADVETFFQDPSASWRPYAAGLPWPRDDTAWSELRQLLRRLDRVGPEANSIAFIRSEPGAGGTTLSRTLAWRAASEGYPTLVARRVPFAPAVLEVESFITRVKEVDNDRRAGANNGSRYEAPWLIVFDKDHWEGRDGELSQFLRSLEQSGRPACILVVSGPIAGLDFLTSTRFKEIKSLTHEVPVASAAEFGQHINRYLAPHGAVRTADEWLGFFRASAVHAESGITAFWVALSFWLQRQIDMTETVQSWLYRQFQSKVKDPELRRALIDIAALSTERRPLPETMLPKTTNWPVSQKLEDLRSEIGAFGLVRPRLEGIRYWALAHDVLGRFLLNALYYDPVTREEAGFPEASSPEHFRFLALRRLSANPSLSLPVNRTIAEDFAVNIFKIDPAKGHATFAMFWSDALAALDEMPQMLWRTSRTLRHHTAISRRRIANDEALFQLGYAERIEILQRAIKDVRYAVENIPPSDRDEFDLNLYNSLARAYQDLHKALAESGASRENS